MIKVWLIPYVTCIGAEVSADDAAVKEDEAETERGEPQPGEPDAEEGEGTELPEGATTDRGQLQEGEDGPEGTTELPVLIVC